MFKKKDFVWFLRQFNDTDDLWNLRKEILEEIEKREKEILFGEKHDARLKIIEGLAQKLQEK